MVTKRTLNEALVDKIDSAFADAKAALGRKDFDAAVRLSDQAWSQVPEPKFGWDFSYAFLNWLVEHKRAAGRDLEATTTLVKSYVDSEYNAPHNFGSHFNLGTLYFERGLLDEAFESFVTADKLSGGHCFTEHDPKYRKFYKERKDALKKASRVKPS